MKQGKPDTWGSARKERAGWRWGVATLAGRVNE
jgi:hypothetical protein